ncbi:interleukin-17 receptor C isoform X1 [Trematomus bernacchii]|uniref:interleukin-17 receptor C isoform X1 n=1 Tax=Trematomus bernacchii TaxID=40690 RepID=UPI00146E8A83|nr:interleukin-17 receptor C isoform X1 [Trematomus bernacchii]
MAPSLLRAPQVSLRLLSVMRFWLFMSARALEIIDRDAPELTCSKGLTDCTVSSAFPFMTNQDGTIDVTNVQLKVILCCSATDCEPCLQILITVQEADLVKEASDQSGDCSDEEELFNTNQKAEGSGTFPEPIATVKVCFSSPGSSDICKKLQFKPSSSGFDQASSQRPKHKQKQLVLTVENVTLGNPVVVQVSRSNKTEIITIPSLEEVCSMNLNRTLKKCDVPRLRFDHERNVVVVVLLQRENSNVTDELMVWNHPTEESLVWPKDDREIILPSKFVAPCMCFQVWWKKDELRKEYCPFLNRQDVLERMQHNVSVSLKESLQRGGASVLIWNVTAPCRLNAEVSLCKKDPAGGRCEEVKGFRQELHDHTGWRAIRSGYSKTDTFDISSHPLLCVQIKIQGIESYIEPQCPFATSRWRWSLPLLIGLLLMSLALLGLYLMQGVLKGYMWRWLKDEDVKGAVGGGHVVLLYPPDDNQALPEMMSHLGSSLQALGFTVSLDLWSQTELSVLGPVPWLHSRLNRLQKQGGKVVLVLTQAAWIRAEEWGARSSERNNPHRDIEETGRSYTASSPCVDVFTASLSCILADYLQGRAGERFVLVQFESLPPEPPGGFRPLPELFRGLHVYSLPSQSLGFLTELAGARQMATASARRKRAGGLRMASRALAQGLSGFTAGTTVLRLAGVSQSCVGVGVEDSGETVPLQQCLITPPSSTDSSPKLNAMEWV